MLDSTAPLDPQVTDQHAHAEELDPVFLPADTDPQAMNAMNQELITGFRATDGHLGGAFRGVPLLLLTTTGARSRLPRTTPVNYTPITGGWVVVASKSGSARHPDWYHNLLADPAAGAPRHITVTSATPRATPAPRSRPAPAARAATGGQCRR